MKVSAKNLRKQYRIIYESLLDDPRVFYEDLVPKLGLCSEIASKRLREASELFLVVGPEIRKRFFENLTEYMYFVKCEDPEAEYVKYQKNPGITFLANTIGFCDLWIVSNEEIEIEGEVILKGPRSDFYVSRAPDHSWNDALEIMNKKVRVFNPRKYEPRNIIQTHWNETVKWDEKDEFLYRHLKYELRKPYTPTLHDQGISEWKFRDFLDKLPQRCTISTGYFPEGLLSYDYYLYKFETDYEDFIIGLFSELPTTSYFFKVSDKLFTNIRVPKEWIRDIDPEAARKKSIRLLVMNLKEKGIIKRKERAMVECYQGKNL